MSTQPQYGNPIASGPTKVFGWLPFRVLVAAIISVVFALFLTLLKLFLLALLLLLVVFSSLLIGFVPFGDSDRTIVQRILMRRQHRKRAARGETTFFNAHISALSKEDQLTLPGFLHTIEPKEALDGQGNSVELLHHKAVKMATVTLGCSPVGGSSLPEDRLIRQVGQYGNWLSRLSRENGLVGAMVVVDSLHTSAEPMANEITQAIDPSAPEVSQQILRQTVGMLPAKTTRVTTYVTLGWKLSALDTEVEGAFAEILAKLPHHITALTQAGSGQTYPLNHAEYGDLMYTAYNPARVAEIDQELYGKVLAIRSFNSSGPTYMNGNHKRVVLHDGVASMTILMSVPDQSKITPYTYQALFAPSQSFLRKRVAMFYRPIPAFKQRSRMDQTSRAASTEAGSKQRNTFFDTKKKAATKNAEAQMANGATIQEYCVMVTVTFEPNRKAQRAAENELKTLMGGMRWSYADFVSEAAFHQTLPIGIFPWVYSSASNYLLPTMFDTDAGRPTQESSEDAHVEHEN